MKQKKKAISLIVLIITVVVIIILATAIIVNLAQTNIIKNANEAVVKQDFKSMQQELNLYIADEFTKTGGKIDITTVDADTIDSVKAILKSSSKSKYIEYVRIEDGKIVFIEGTDEQLMLWANEAINSTGSATTLPDNPIVPDEPPAVIYTAQDVAADPTTFYGQYVTNYVPNNNSSVGWKIFYSDEEKIYLIADDYVEISQLPYYINDNGETTTSRPTKDSNSYTKSASLDNVVGPYSTGSQRISEEMKLLNYDYFITKGYSSTTGNMKCTAYLLDTQAWGTEFGNENAKYVIGGPTIELLFASYNHKMNTTFESQAANSNGYVIRKNSTESWQTKIAGMLSTSDPLYVITSTEGAQGYFISSPSTLASGAYIMRLCSDGTINNWGGSTTYLGFRPVVCLNSNVNLKVSEESYEIITSK